MSDDEYTHGGYIPGGPVETQIHPDECIINRHGECIRPGHPTPISARFAKLEGSWRCEPR